MSEKNEKVATGRRKTSVARVRLGAGSGKIQVNGRSLNEYFVTDSQRLIATQALMILQNASQFDIRINVCGGGLSGQAGAVRHGISRALLQVDPEFRSALKGYGLLTRDPRMKERKKYGQPGARKRFQYSKR